MFKLEIVAFPKEALESVDVRATYRNIVAGRVRRVLQRIASDADSHTPYASMQGGYAIVQRSGGSSLEFTVENRIDKWPFVEYDTRAHNIPHAWGRPYPFGTSGRFDGYFHPGTRGKHMFQNAWDEGAELIADGIEEATAAWLARWGNIQSGD